MQSIVSPFTAILPEVWLTGMSCLVLLLDLFFSKQFRFIAYHLSLIALIGSLFFILQTIGFKEVHFHDSFILDSVGQLLKFVICFFAVIVFLYSRQHIAHHQFPYGEYYALSLFSILGMMVLVSAYNLLTLYLGVELLALPLYALISITKTKKSAEAAMKYFVMGALASGMLLFGISLLYGATGSFEIKKLAAAFSGDATPQLSVMIGLVLVLIGLAFKLGAVPFHMWVPDIYEGTSANIIIFIATLPEIAGFGMAIRLLVDAFSGLTAYWQQLWIIMAVLSLILGNVAAIAQSNIKRMLAYSSIGHMGFVFLGLLAGPKAGFGPALAYIIIYSLMALGAFGIIVSLSHKGFEAEKLSNFKGLGKSQPWVAFMFLLILFSLAGVPPTIGFYAKFLVLSAVVDAGFYGLAVVAVITTVIGAYYYLRIIRLMFFEELEEHDKHDNFQVCKKLTQYDLALVSGNGLIMLLLGMYPAPFISMCLAVFK